MNPRKRRTRIISVLCALILAVSLWTPIDAQAANQSISQGSTKKYTAKSDGETLTVTLSGASANVSLQSKPSWITTKKNGNKFTLTIAPIQGVETRTGDVVFRESAKLWTLRVTQNCAHTYSWQVIKSASCCKPGKQAFQCSKCKKLGPGSNNYKVIPATGNHQWGAWVIDIDYTCTTPGKRHRVCINPGGSATQYETLPAAHRYMPKVNDFGEKYCTGCNLPDYDFYINSSTHYISTSNSDENRKAKGGKAGDSTKLEWNMTTSFGSINVTESSTKKNVTINVYRYNSNANVGKKLAYLSIEAALNNNIGYDQGQRTTYKEQLELANWDPKKITTECEQDCSAGVSTNVIAVGKLLGISSLSKMPISYSGDIGDNLINAGYSKVYTNKKSLSTTEINSLRAGDILVVRYQKLNDKGEWEWKGHATVNVTGK